MSALLGSLLAVLENKPEKALRLMEGADTTSEPEIQVYFARHYARLGYTPAAIRFLERAAQSGFVCSPATLRLDSWLNSLGEQRGIRAFLASSEAMVKAAERLLCAEFPDGFSVSLQA